MSRLILFSIIIILAGCSIEHNGNLYKAFGKGNSHYIHFNYDSTERPFAENYKDPYIMEACNSDIDTLIIKNDKIFIYIWSVSCSANDSAVYYMKNFKNDHPDYKFVMLLDAYLYNRAYGFMNKYQLKDKLFVLADSCYGHNTVDAIRQVNEHFGLMGSLNKSFCFVNGKLMSYGVKPKEWAKMVRK
ncbi:MAG: hypothetical protein JSS96_08030 [Bacteroidetes bacterium]|nr:hypothetical protein [Bacteroidota bacterium]